MARHQALCTASSVVGLAAGIGGGWPSLPARRGVKNDLVDIETHVTKPVLAER